MPRKRKGSESEPAVLPKVCGKPKRSRRMRIVAEDDGSGNYESFRDVYLESKGRDGVWRTDLAEFRLPLDRVLDLVKWCAGVAYYSTCVDVVCQPSDNLNSCFEQLLGNSNGGLFDGC